MNKHASIAAIAARTAGDFVKSRAADISNLKIEQKSLNDYVSEVDRESEKIIYEVIASEFPQHSIVGEEFGLSASLSEYQWVVDPLDGTTNFLRGIAHYAISIALKHDGKIIHGTVFDPIKDELFSASRGLGASLNGSPITVSERSSMSGGLYATGVPFNGRTLNNLSCFTDCLTAVVQQQTSGVRRLGSAALDLAYVAAGRYEGYWEANLKLWDIAAGVLLVEEAGGMVADLFGGDQFLDNGHVVAACPGAYQSLLDITTNAYSAWH